MSTSFTNTATCAQTKQTADMPAVAQIQKQDWPRRSSAKSMWYKSTSVKYQTLAKQRHTTQLAPSNLRSSMVGYDPSHQPLKLCVLNVSVLVLVELGHQFVNGRARWGQIDNPTNHLQFVGVEMTVVVHIQFVETRSNLRRQLVILFRRLQQEMQRSCSVPLLTGGSL